MSARALLPWCRTRLAAKSVLVPSWAEPVDRRFAAKNARFDSSTASGTSTAFASLLPTGWRKALDAEIRDPRFDKLATAVMSLPEVAPPLPLVFAALKATPLHRVRVVLLGQDPYPTPGDANGLAFSVNAGRRPPKSLHNLFQEMVSDGFPAAAGRGPDLSDLAAQGVLLLNCTLTTRPGTAHAHKSLGWRWLTAAILRKCAAPPAARREPGEAEPSAGVVFIMLGNEAQSKIHLLRDVGGRNAVVTGAHPSPLSQNQFFGCKPFSRCNAELAKRQCAPIVWA